MSLNAVMRFRHFSVEELVYLKSGKIEESKFSLLMSQSSRLAFVKGIFECSSLIVEQKFHSGSVELL